MKALKKVLVGGFVNKKIVLAIALAVVLVLGTGYLAQNFLFSSKVKQSPAPASVYKNPETNGMPNVSGGPTKSQVVEQQCAICKSMNKAGAKSSCMTDLKCK